MKRKNQVSSIKNKIISLIVVMLIIIIDLVTFATVFAEKNEDDQKINSNNNNRIADISTVDTYKNSIDDISQGTKNDGYVWADKSVYAQDSTNKVTLDNKFDIQYDEDFLSVFSALGSSQKVYAEELAPLDVVLLLDISTSMTTTSGGEYRDSAQRVIREANKLINDLMGKNEIEVNKSNRIGVVVYGGGTQVLLPLNHYEISDGDQYITLDSSTYKNTKYWPTTTTHVKVEGQTFENRTSKFMYADATYLQGALYQGMHMLATEPTTTYTNPKTGVEFNRVPVLIVLTDGATNIVGATKTGNVDTSIEWWDPLSWATATNSNEEVLIPTRYNDQTDDYRNFIPTPNGNPIYISCSGGKDLQVYDAIAPRTLATLLTAGYMKNWIEDNYNSKVLSKDKISLLGFGIGYNLSNNYNNLTQLNSTMNPKEYFINGSEDEQIQKAYTTLETYLSNDGQTPKLEFNNDYTWLSQTISASWDFNHPSGDNEKYDVKSIDDVYYIDKYLTADDENIDKAFEEIFSEIVEKTVNNPFIPIKGENFLGAEDSLTYVDPIGEYLEVKDVTDLLLFGKRYNVIEREATAEEKASENSTKIYKYYKAVGDNGEEISISNPSYNSEDMYKLSDIRIWKETDKNSETSTNANEKLHIEIPNMMIPIKLDTLNLNLQREVQDYQSNNGTDDALPIRIVYTVGIKDELINENKVYLSMLSKEYISKNMNEDGLYFYANKYSGNVYNKDDTSTLGDAIVSFSPSFNNPFYVYQENLIIYKNSSGGNSDGEGILVESGGNVTLTEEVKDMSEINRDETYYYITEIYLPQEESGTKGKLVKYAVSQKGEDFFGNNNESYLTYYDTDLGKEVETKGEHTVVATKIGGSRINNLKKLAMKKEQNITATASNYYTPIYANVDNKHIINVYLGNNGRLLVNRELLENEEKPKQEDKNEIVEDKTVAQGAIPQTGEGTNLILIVIALNLGIGIFAYIRHRMLKF